MSGNILSNPLVEFAIIIGILGVLAVVPFFTAASAGLLAGQTTAVGLISLVVILWLFGPRGPLKR